ncbi:quinone oxidoreductase [Ahrensia sp. R2A130]|uniref:quinone oxidoreductase family protein n=1 Tax=Ahrensia sp. R2A130 TaxID=744979 RepID=UPI0001E0D80D|nr:quinone oxidoreductase [Ahrensia sp. R2A130]EFL90333.1 quinone oxidoreductase [Ahrensia sp. R2A130]
MGAFIEVTETGGPEVLKLAQRDVPTPGAGEALVRQTAIGLNYIDVYFRTGLYPAPSMPFTPGMEGAGVVEAVGEGVTVVKPGDRVAYASAPVGAYAEERLIAADRLMIVPEGISDDEAAAMMLQGMTAQYLLRQTFKVKAGNTVLFHAAAGGVGLIAGQWGKSLGATMIGTAGSPEKMELAKANGYDHVINYRDEDFVERVMEITGGAKCDVVYDSVGKDTFPGSLDCLKTRGMWASFGQSSGKLPDVDLGILAAKGSLFATRPTLFNYIATRSQLEETAGDLFEVVQSGAMKIAINQTFPLADAKGAHEALEGRRTVGSTLLKP